MSLVQQLSSRAIIGRYYKRLEQKPGMEWIDSISNYFKSDQPIETYNWLGQSPVMREWIGGRQAKGLSSHGISIENRHFEGTLEINTRDLRLDKTDQIKARIEDFADRTNTHWAGLLSDLIIGGESSVCYDGQYFFDTDHQEDKSGIQSNKIQVDLTEFSDQIEGGKVGTPQNPSEAALRLAVLRAIQQIKTFKDNEGQPMNEFASSFVLMIPSSMWYVAEAAIGVALTVGGASNPVKILRKLNITVIENPRLNWNNKFVLFRTNSSIKSFIRQEEKGIQLKAIAEGSELEFNHDKHWYGVDTWRNVGYGFWQNACLTEIIKT